MGRKPSNIIRIEIASPRCTVYVGRELWYVLGKPERVLIRRDRNGATPHELIIKASSDQRGFAVCVSTYQMPRISIGSEYALQLGLIDTKLVGIYDPAHQLITCDLRQLIK